MAEPNLKLWEVAAPAREMVVVQEGRFDPASVHNTVYGAMYKRWDGYSGHAKGMLVMAERA